MARQKVQTPPTDAPAVPPKNAKKSPATAIKYYLVAYNVLSTLAWSYILISLLLHLTGLSSTAPPATRAAQTHVQSATAKLSSFFSSASSRLPYLKNSSSRIASQIPFGFKAFFGRCSTSYAAVGPETTLVQSMAILEVVHAALGWVRSPIQTTAMQVASRLFLVWGVSEQYDSARSSPLYASMVLAWSLTEVIRYSFYACNLLGKEPYPLLFLRYTTFLALYPIGAGSEAFVNYATLPKSWPIPGLSSWVKGQQIWMPLDYVRGVLFLIWWPGLYFMYTYMLVQRRKVLGGKKLGAKPKSL